MSRRPSVAPVDRRVVILLDAAGLAALDAARGNLSRSAFAREAVMGRCSEQAAINATIAVATGRTS